METNKEGWFDRMELISNHLGQFQEM